MWNDLIITHEGTSQVKRSKIDLLHSQYENFYMFDNESIDEMLTRFMKITNRLALLGGEIDNDQKVKKGNEKSSQSLGGQGNCSQEA